MNILVRLSNFFRKKLPRLRKDYSLSENNYYKVTLTCTVFYSQGYKLAIENCIIVINWVWSSCINMISIGYVFSYYAT